MAEEIDAFVKQVAPWLYMLVLSTWGGVVHYLQALKRSGRSFEWYALFLDLITASFAGLLANLLCESAGIKGAEAAAIVAVSGHMGARAIGKLESVYSKLLKG